VITRDASRDRRLIFLAATTKDASTMQSMLAPTGIRVDVCRSFAAMIQEARAGLGVLMLGEEMVTPANNAALTALLAAQPPWSDLPVLVLTRPGADSERTIAAVRTLGNVTLIERPVRLAALVSAVRTAIRARDRQYQIREHLAERARAEESLRLADQRKDEFLATLGHELRNPLAPLLTALHLLRTVVPPDELVTRVGDVMERQINHLVRLVDDLLEVSRITRGSIQIHREPLDLSEVVQAAVDTSRPALDAAEHELTITQPHEPVVVNADPVRLTQVLANLLTNAAKYTNPGGRILLQVRRDGDRAVVSVKDNGIGIAADQLNSVFEMFTQVDRSSRRAQGGLGIGLTLVRSLVAMHGGHVEARSDGLGRGSEFVVSLPVATGVPKQSEPGLPKDFPCRRVLVVDDNRDAAQMLGQLLTALGAEVRVAYSGRSALEVFPEFRPECVLLDIGMPDMDGYEVARRMRATGQGADVLLVALTGWGQEPDQRRSREAGFDHHVVKPPDIDKLRDLIASNRGPAARGRFLTRDVTPPARPAPSREPEPRHP
jgi:signal transduction histidine kinase/ActR/RegA family two-component response regulator